MDEKRRRERQRQAKRLMKALTEGEPILITESGDINEQPRTVLPDSFEELIALRQREYEAIRSQRRPTETYTNAEERGDQKQREHEAYHRTLEGIASRLDIDFSMEDDAVKYAIYEAMMRLPDEVREFVHDNVVFLCTSWGQAFRGRDWSESWIILLAPDLLAEDAVGVVAHEIAHAWCGHGQGHLGKTPEEEREACDLVRTWGFVGRGAVFERPEGHEPISYIN